LSPASRSPALQELCEMREAIEPEATALAVSSVGRAEVPP